MADAADTTSTEGAEGASEVPVSGGVSDLQSKGTGAGSAEKQEFELKVNGRTEKWSLEKLISKAQLAEGANQKFEEAAKLRRETESKYKDPLNLLKDQETRKKLRAAIEQEIIDEIQAQTMDPKDRRIMELERAQKSEAARRKAQEDEVANTEFEAEKAKQAAKYDTEITEALSASNLPKTPRTVRRVAQLMRRNLDLELELPMASVVEIVKDEYLSEQKELLGGLNEESILQYLDKDVAKKFKSALLKKYKAAPTATNPGSRRTAAPVNESKTGKDAKMLNEDAWDELMEKRKQEWRNE